MNDTPNRLFVTTNVPKTDWYRDFRCSQNTNGAPEKTLQSTQLLDVQEVPDKELGPGLCKG